MRYRKKPVVVDAFKLNERGLVEEDWFWDAVSENKIITHYFGKYHPQPAWCEIKTLEGVMVARAGDYIIKGIAGEIYPCRADIFEATYELYEEQPTVSKKATVVDEWIPVSERLPDGKEDSYLVTRTDGKFTWVEEGDFVVDRFIFLGDEYRFNTKQRIEDIAWMPLPSPYKDDNSCKKCNNQDWRLP